MNPCPKCQSYGKCSGTCWVLDFTKMSDSIEAEMNTPEFQNVLSSTVPYIGLLKMGRTDEEMYLAHKRLEEMV